MSLSALRSRLADGKLAPVYLVTGFEKFLAEEAVRLIINAAAGDGEHNRSFYHGDNADLATVLDDVRTPGLFAARRVAVVSPADKFLESKQNWDALAAYVEAPARGACLVLVAAKADGKRKLTKRVHEAGGLVACQRLYQRDVIPWIFARVKAMDRQIESPAAALLAEFLGTDLAALAGEIDKLTTYLGDRKRIKTADVEAVSLRDHTHEVYELTDSIGRRQPARALTLLNSLLEQGERVGKIISVVARHIRRLWTAKELLARGAQPAAAAQQVGIYYFVEQFIAQVEVFTFAELRRAVSALVHCEATLKTSAMDDRVLLETTFLQLARREREPAASRD